MCPEFISKLMEEGRLNADERDRSQGRDSTDEEAGRVCNTPELEKECAQLVKCRRHCWKPKLETIKEKEKKIDVKRLIFKIMT